MLHTLAHSKIDLKRSEEEENSETGNQGRSKFGHVAFYRSEEEGELKKEIESHCTHCNAQDQSESFLTLLGVSNMYTSLSLHARS